MRSGTRGTWLHAVAPGPRPIVLSNKWLSLQIPGQVYGSNKQLAPRSQTSGHYNKQLTPKSPTGGGYNKRLASGP